MFLGHRNDIITNCWKVLPQFNSTQTLLNDNGQYFLQSNLCPHQGSLIRTGAGNSLTATCPYHGWSWNSKGNPRGSGTVGHSAGSVECKNTAQLTRTPVVEWSGFMFNSNYEIPVDFDISGDYKLEEYRQDIIQANYIPVMDLFLDIDHIPIVHPGVYDLIDIPNVKDITWKSWNGGSMQTVSEGKAIWLALYPGVMFEYQPGAVFVMVNESIDSTTTKSHVFKYRDYSYSYGQWVTNNNVWEMAWKQDREQAERLEPGWRTIPLENLDQEKIKFRQWNEKNLDK